MNETAAELVGRVSQTDQLIRGQESSGNLDPLHLHAFLALSISAKVQPQFLHLRLINFTCSVLPDLLLIIGQLVPHIVGKKLSLRFDRGWTS